MKRNVFRVVVVRDINVIWASDRLFSTKERAISYIERFASDDEGLYGHSTEQLNLARPQCYCLDEGAHHTWLTVDLVTSVHDDDFPTVTYGVVEYELD